MTDITGLNGVDWLAVFAASFGLGLAVLARRKGPGRRVGGFLAAPLVVGVATVVMAVASHPGTLRRMGSARPAAIVVAVGVLVAGFVFADFVFSRVVPVVVGWFGGLPVDLVISVALVVLVAVGFLALGVIELRAPALTSVTVTTTTPGAASPPVVPASSPPTTTTSTLPTVMDGRFELLGVVVLPGEPMGIAVDLSRDLGYVSLGEGSIVRFAPSSLADGRDPSFVGVASGLESPRGIEIVGDELVVAEMGPLPCDPPFPSCRGVDVPGVDVSDPAAVRAAEAEILAQSSGRVASYAIDSSGDLSGRRVILDGLPVANTLHGVNGITLGPNGHLYLAIGNVGDANVYFSDTLAHPRKDLLGTILEFLPDGTVLGTYATGLRNVYDVTFDPSGEMWGVDNDGFTPAGWREEELLQLKQGAEYGFPYEGSFTHLIRTDGAVAALNQNGSAGIAWIDDPSIGSGILTGSCGGLSFVEMEPMGGSWRIVNNDADQYTRVLLEPPGCVSGIALDDGLILATDFRWDGPGILYVLRLADQ